MITRVLHKWLALGVTAAGMNVFASPAVTTLPENRFLQFNDYLMTNDVPATWVHQGPMPASGANFNRALLAGTNHVHRAGWVFRSCRMGTAAYLGYAIPPRIPTAVPTYPAVASNLAANLQNANGASIESPALTNGVGAVYFEAINSQLAYTNELTVEIATNMVDAGTGEIVPTVLPPSTNNLNYVWEPLNALQLSAAGSNDFVRYSRVLNVRAPVKLRIRRSSGIQAGLWYDTAFAVVDNIRLSRPPAEVTVTNATAFGDAGGHKIQCFVSNVDANAPATNRTVTAFFRWPGLTPPANDWTNVAMTVAAPGDGNGNGERYEVTLPYQPYGGDLHYYVTCAFDGYWYAATDYTGLGYTGYPVESRSPFTSSAQTQTLAEVGRHVLTVSGGSGSGSYTNGQPVAIAATTPAGMAFERWTGATQYVADVAAPNTLVTMPDEDIALAAAFTNAYYTLSVVSGSGGGSYTNGQRVAIAADPQAGTIFSRWTGAAQHVANVFAADTTVTMPASNIAVTATYLNVYALTVTGGSGGGSYTNGQRVAIAADAPAPGKVFLRWSGDTAFVASPTSPSTTVTMPALAIAVTALYVDVYVLTVTGGSGSGSYTNGQRVAVTAAAPPPGKVFECWEGDTATVANVWAASTTVTMPAADVALAATYVDVYTLTVTGGSGSGSYTNGQQVAILADAPPIGRIFAGWAGATQYVYSATAPSARVTMPAADIALAATYTNVYYTLTVADGTGGGSYTNGHRAAIAAIAQAGKVFDRWAGDTQRVANVFATNTTVTMPAAAVTVAATYLTAYTLTVTGGSGGGSYTNGQRVAIAADAPAPGKAFLRWAGDTAFVASPTSPSTTVTMPALAIAVTALYVDVYALTVTGGSGGGSYTNGQRVSIMANAASPGKVFARWAGATQHVADVASPSTQVTMPTFDIALTATYSNLYYRLTVTGGSGSGVYTNGQRVAIAASVPASQTFDQWAGDTACVMSVMSSNTIVTMPAAPVFLTALLKSKPSVLSESRFLHFNDYLQTNLPSAVWAHEGPLPASGAAVNRALLAGTNHYHRTGWKLLSCRTGSAAYLGTSIPPRVPNTPPVYPAIASNLAANLRYDLGALIESPVFTDGLGTLYFETVCNTLDGGQLTVEAATNMWNVATGEISPTLTPATTNGFETVWETLSVLDLATTNEFTRFRQTLNYRGTIKLRLRRTGELNPAITSRDTAFIVVDNIRVSQTPSDVTVYKAECPFEPGYPNVNTGLSVRCYVSNADTNTPSDSRVVKCVNRWRFLNQLVQPWRTNLMTAVTGTGDGQGNGERFEVTLPPYSEPGDLEYYFVCDFSGYVYQSPDYTGQGYVYPPEGVFSRTCRSSDGQEYAVRLRTHASRYAQLDVESDQHGSPIAMTLVGDHAWRALVPLTGLSLTNLTWRFKAAGHYEPGSEAASTGVTYWAAASGTSFSGTLPRAGLCAETDGSGRLSVSVDTGNYVMLTFNTETLQVQASRGEYQDFNAWPAPASVFTEGNGSDPITVHPNTFSQWPTNAFTTFCEPVAAFVSSTNVYQAGPFSTPQSWAAGNAAYCSERTLVDNTLNAVPGVSKFRNLALRLKGASAPGFVQTSAATLPDGLRDVSFKCRLSQEVSQEAVVYYRHGATNFNYLVRANAFAVTSAMLSPETPSLSLAGYYRDANNFYEYRITQIMDPNDSIGSIVDRRVRHQIYKWANGAATLLASADASTSAGPLTALSTTTIEMRLYNVSGTQTRIRCKYGLIDNVVTALDSASPIQSGTFGFLSADCFAACSSVVTQPTTTDAAATGVATAYLRNDVNFTADVVNWHLPDERYRALDSVSPKGIYSVIPSQQVGVYVQDTAFGSATEPNDTDWRLIRMVTVSNYAYQAVTVPTASWRSQFVKLRVVGAAADVAVDELAVASWRGVRNGLGETDPREWVATESWVVSNATAQAQAVQLDLTRADPAAEQALRAPLLENGLGVMEFDYRVLRAPARLTVQYATKDEPTMWTDVGSLVLSNAVGWSRASAHLGASEPGYFRLLNARTEAYTNAWVEVDNAAVWDQPAVTSNAWRAYNAKITSTDTNRVSLDESKACFLNNSPTAEAVPSQNAFEPFVQSPTLPNGLGKISFQARAYTNNQAATLYLYATVNGWDAPAEQWFELARIENVTNGLYKAFSFKPADGRTYSAVRLGTKTTAGARRICLEDIAIAEPLPQDFAASVSLAEAVDTTNLVVSTGGHARWDGRASAAAYDGVDAAQSGALGDGQASWMEAAVTGPGALTFWWKASCEDAIGNDADYLCLSVDGVEQGRIDGESGWQPVTCAVGPGAHVVRWEYRKNGSLGGGGDCAWVDQVAFARQQETGATLTTPVPVPYAWLDGYPLLLASRRGNYESAAWADFDGDGLKTWEEYVTGTAPTNSGSLFLACITMSNGLPRISWMPDLGAARVYTVEGSTNLTEGTWGTANAGSRFFRIRVQLP